MALVDSIEIFVNSKMTKKSTLSEVERVFCLSHTQLLTHLKKSPVLFHLPMFKTDSAKRDILYYVTGSTILYATGDDRNEQDMLVKLRDERHNRFIKSNYAECKNILQLIGTYIYNNRFKPCYVTIKELYKQYSTLFHCNIDNKHLIRVNVNKVVTDFKKIGIEFTE